MEHSDGSKITVTVTVENHLTNDETRFCATRQLETTSKPAYDIIRELEQVDPRFQMKTTEHGELGHFVTHVNGVKGDWDEMKTFWAVLKRTSNGDCLTNKGVSSYIPADGEHLVLSLVKSSHGLPPC